MSASSGIEPNQKAPSFELPNANQKLGSENLSLSASMGENGAIVLFTCNHCPYVKSIINRIIRDASELHKLGINSVGIMSNDPNEYEEDSFENMVVSEIIKSS